jgi:hypothetical protein
MTAQRHMHEYGTTREQLARVAVQMRSNASRGRVEAADGTLLMNLILPSASR